MVSFDDGEALSDGNDGGASADGLESSGVEEGSLADDLQFLREEEKLARDVYITLYSKWQINIHDNISRSEQQHMDAIKGLLDQRGISDPVVDDAVGVFVDEDLKGLYGGLSSQGSLSELDALVVGATIEDLDIEDIEQMKARTSDQEVLAVFDSLQCGSRNHLRSFVAQLTRRGGEYTPQYISATIYAEILAADPELCGLIR